MLNNISIHLFKNFVIIYKKIKIYLKYLFLYLFNYNLIEKFFFILKI